MNTEHRQDDEIKKHDAMGEILHDVGDEFFTVVSVPGQTAFRSVMQFFHFIGDTSIILARTLGLILKGKIDVRDTISQMAIIGVDSLPVVLITTAFSGAVLALYMSQIVVSWGVGSVVGSVVGLSITREIAPVLAAVTVAARAGSAIAAEIGSMKVTEQIDALRSLAVSPLQYLVVPRFLACVIMLPALAIFGDVIGIIAGYLVAKVLGVAGGGFLNNLRSQVLPYDVFMGLLKTVFFGAVIALVGSQQGLRTDGGAAGVGKSTTGAVVITIVIIYVLNFVLAYIMFGGKAM